MMSNLWSSLKGRITKPLLGLGAVSVSTVLAACYGPPPEYLEFQKTEEFCEQILQNGCKDENGSLPLQCGEYCNYLKDKKARGNDIVVPECCPE